MVSSKVGWVRANQQYFMDSLIQKRKKREWTKIVKNLNNLLNKIVPKTLQQENNH